MGNRRSVPVVDPPDGRPKKRTIADVEDEEVERLQEANLNTPKKKRLKSTSKYIYNTLFVNGENSDVKIIALGKEWSLHKVYLCQSGYFSSMFSGSWRESTMDVINIDIPDLNIDEQALEVAFGSLYRDDVSIIPTKDGLIQQCIVIMRETVNARTVCHYYAAALMYAQPEVTNQCLDWLEKNIMTAQNMSLLREISTELMTHLVSSPKLFVMQVEMDIYSMLKRWIFLQINTCWDGPWKEVTRDADEYFKSRNSGHASTFLDTPTGQPYRDACRGLRLQHIVNDLASVRLLEDDRIIPTDWLAPLYRIQWKQMLRIEQKADKGPETLPRAVFERQAMRCGRVLVSEIDYCWRWTGYSYGMDLLVTYSNKLLSFKRNTHSQSCPGAVSLQDRRHIMFKVTAASLDTLGQTMYISSSPIESLSLSKDEEVVVLRLDRKASFPLHISVQYLVYTPDDSAVQASDLVELPGQGDAPPEEPQGEDVEVAQPLDNSDVDVDE